MSKLIGGRYEIIRKIAEGGMGAVFEARHHMTKKIVALKILFPHIGKNEASRQRFLREVSAPAQIGHDGIVDVTDSGFDSQDGSLFVAMEMLRGETVREWLERGGHSRDEVLDLFVRALNPLTAAHATGIIHRDLKPENIFIHDKKNGTKVVKILDFGIARDLDTSSENVTQTGIAMGTPHYMAPEQAMSARGVIATADVWAIGVMMYEALAGRTPFNGETASAIVVHACTQAHPPIKSLVPDLDPTIAALIDRCLDKDPTKRPRDAGELSQLLQAARPGRQIEAAMTGGPSMSTPLTREAAIAQPSLSASNFGTAPPAIAGGFGAPTTPHAQTPHAQTPPPYAQTPAPQHTPPYTPPQHTPPQHTPQPFGQGGFGAPTAPTSPGGGGPMYTPTPAAMVAPSGSKKGLFIGLGVGVFVIAVAIVAVVVSSNDDPSTGLVTTPPGHLAGPGIPPATGMSTASISTPDGGGELFIDGISQGPIASGGQIQLAAGPHTLELRVGGSSFASQQVIAVAGQALIVNLATSVAPAGAETRQGALAPGDGTLNSGEFADTYTFQWTAGQTVRLDLRSSVFDAYLIVRAPSGTQSDNDDAVEGSSDTHAGLDVVVSETGTWSVLATSYRTGEQGAYQLTIAPR